MAASLACAAGASGDAERSAAPRSGLFWDANARLFTLLHHLDVFDAVGVLPSGDLLVVRYPQAGEASSGLWRLGLDGRFEQIGTVPGAVEDFAVESSTAILIVRDQEPRVERYDLVTGQLSVAVTLPKVGGLQRVVVLDDHSIVASDGYSAWWARSDGVRRVLPGKEHTVTIGSLAAVPGGAFAYFDLSGNNVLRVGADGRRRTLVRGGGDWGDAVTELASAGDQLVVVRGSNADLGVRARIIRISGGRIREVIERRADPPVYGDGDGYGPMALAVDPRRVLLASDGSLLVLHDSDSDSRLRALAPPASPRLRVALRPTTWRRFVRGRVDYAASASGELDLRIKAAGRATVTQLKTNTAGGTGTLRLPRTLPRGDYTVRLTLRTPAGGRTTAKARIVTLAWLSLGHARRALQREFNDSEGDVVSGGGTKVGGRCVRRDPRRVDCRLIQYEWSEPHYHATTCRGWLVAQLRPDGVSTSTSRLDCP